MYQPNLPHFLAKSALPRTMQDYNAALTNAGSFLREIEKAHANPLPGDPLAKSTFSQSNSPTSGLTYYDLETGAKFLFPVLTPLRNEIPRVSGKGGIQANWRAVTGINTTGLRIGVSGGNRGGVSAVSTQDYIAAYKGIGIETSVDFEARICRHGLRRSCKRDRARKTRLEALMLGEELIILGGNRRLRARHHADAVARAVDHRRQPDSRPQALQRHLRRADARRHRQRHASPAASRAQITRTNADGSSDTFGGGAAGKSTNATASISSGTDRLDRRQRRAGAAARSAMPGSGARPARKCSARSPRSIRSSSPRTRPARRPRPRSASATIRPTRWCSTGCCLRRSSPAPTPMSLSRRPAPPAPARR